MEAGMLEPGSIIQGRYEVVRLIGKGGMGAVYEALDQRLRSRVALKQTLVTGENLKKAFEREAHILASLRHPALTKVSDYFTDDAGEFLVMDFIPGKDLASLLEERQSPFPLDEVLQWADQLLDALDYLHTQQIPIIHRDIKPQNLKLTPRGEIILLDFGLAKGAAGPHSRVTTGGSIFGYTPKYAPLEQIQGTGTDPRSDIYSLAATLSHLLTNEDPSDALSRAAALLNKQPDPLRPVHTLNPLIPVAVSTVIQEAMSPIAEERFASAAAMRAALKHARQQPPAPGQHAMVAGAVRPIPLGQHAADPSIQREPGQGGAYTGETRAYGSVQAAPSSSAAAQPPHHTGQQRASAPSPSQPAPPPPPTAPPPPPAKSQRWKTYCVAPVVGFVVGFLVLCVLPTFFLAWFGEKVEQDNATATALALQEPSGSTGFSDSVEQKDSTATALAGQAEDSQAGDSFDETPQSGDLLPTEVVDEGGGSRDEGGRDGGGRDEGDWDMEPVDTLESLPAPDSWTVAMYEPFDDNTQGWFNVIRIISDDVVGTAWVEDGLLRWQITTYNDVMYTDWVDETPYTDFLLRVDIRQNITPVYQGYAGLVFRLMRYAEDAQKETFYVFAISDDQTYMVGLWDDEDEELTRLIDWEESDLIRPGEFNTVGVAAVNDTFWFFINDEYVNEVSDDQLEAGIVGIGLYVEDETEAVIEFDNFELSVPYNDRDK
jgi:serine/threonine protein kinase